MKYQLYENSLNDPDQVIDTILMNRGIKDPDTYINLDNSYCNDYENLNNINEAVAIDILCGYATAVEYI